MTGRHDKEVRSAQAEVFGEVISAYSRREAIEDGVLVDVTETAKQAGFCTPVALTRAVFEDFVRVPKGVPCQDEAGRLWDIIWMLGFAIASDARGGFRELEFKLNVRNDSSGPQRVVLKAVSGPGDEGEQVLTIMLPEED